jgi:hypothetical protein
LSLTPQTSPAEGLGQYVTLEEFRQAVRLDPRTFRRYLAGGKLPPPDIAFSFKHQLWKRERVARWLAEQGAAREVPDGR